MQGTAVEELLPAGTSETRSRTQKSQAHHSNGKHVRARAVAVLPAEAKLRCEPALLPASLAFTLNQAVWTGQQGEGRSEKPPKASPGKKGS